METNEYDIFISYSRKDFQMAKKMKKDIEKSTDAVCWMDMEGIESGAQFEDIIVTAIDKSKMILFLLSENSMQSKWVKDEIRYAYETGKKVVPANIDGCTPTGWFLFKFGGRDVIDCSNEIQRNKMMENIKLWFPKSREDEENEKVKGEMEEKVKRREGEEVKNVWKDLLENPRVRMGGFTALIVVCIGLGWAMMPLECANRNGESEVIKDSDTIRKDTTDSVVVDTTKKDTPAVVPSPQPEPEPTDPIVNPQPQHDTTHVNPSKDNLPKKPKAMPTSGSVALVTPRGTYTGELKDGKPYGNGSIKFEEDYEVAGKEYHAGDVLTGVANATGSFQAGTTTIKIKTK